MPSYIRRSGDEKFRRVSIQNTTLPPFTEFTSLGEAVQYSDVQVVEVLRADGTTELFHEGGIEIANYGAAGIDRLLIEKSIPRARLWIRRADGTGIPYKVPAELPVKGNHAELKVPRGVKEMELFGDKYLEAVYQFHRT